jgi:hypothetical protein
MPDFMDSATSVADGTADELHDLLGGQAAESEAGVEEESEQPSDADVAEVTDGEDAAAAESEEQTDEQSDEESSEESEEAAESEEAGDEEEEAGELELDESDHDYSQAAYERAAKIYSKNLKLPADQQFDPNNAKDRAALKEMMDRGEGFKSLKQQLEEAQAGKTEVKKDATTEEATRQQEAPRPPTEEEIKTFIGQAEEVAKNALIPQVSMHFATTIANMLGKGLHGSEWPAKGVKLSQQEADGITTALGAGFNMMLMQNSGMITNGVKSAIFADRGVANAVNLGTRELGLQAIGEMKDASGKDLYPDLTDLVETGTLKKVFQANPALAQIKAGDGSDPVANYAAQAEAAIKIARGEVGNANVSKALATGKKQADLRAKKLGASRVAAGITKGIRTGQSHADKTVAEITSGKGSAFEAAVERDAPMRRNG